LRTLALVLVVLCSSVTAQAQNREWNDATVIHITSETTEGPFVVVPLGGSAVGGTIKNHWVHYDIETEDVVYVLAWVNKNHPLNVTLHGKTKIALDRNGRDAYILDDAAKEVKLPITRKTARPKDSAPAPAPQQNPPAPAPQPLRLPKTGNELLDDCNQVIRAADSASEAALDPHLDEDTLKFGSCIGYLQATAEMISISQVNLWIGASAGWKLTDPDRKRELPLSALSFMMSVCIADGKVPVGQLARIVVKWLRDHPERLHEPRSGLVLEALRDAFPCPANSPAKKPDTP
jgi:Rap1a immunity proteins